MGVFERLLEELPAIGESADPDDQIRAVLTPILQRIVDGTPHSEPVPADPATCPNCGFPADSERSPYCSTLCRETAAFIRQFRHAIAERTIFDKERQAGMGQALWSLQGGGYPRRQMMVTPKIIAKVIERDGGVCSVCGGPATEVEHTGSG